MSSVVLVLLFVGSGAAALIYEVVWQQLLQLAIGSSTISLGVLLATYMGGMSLGSLYAPRLIGRAHHPLRVYAALEAAIGTMGLLLLAVVPLAGRVYASVGGLGPQGVIVRSLVTAVCLLPPTFAMGATLPAIARFVERSAAGRAWLGFFYAGNLAGAVLGCLGAGFYLLRVFDMHVTTYVAVGLNGLVASAALVLAGRTSVPAWSPAVQTPTSGHREARSLARVYVAALLSGFSALAAEVVWTRMLALAFGATVYTFSLILAVFLTGLGIGSAAGAALARHLRRPAVAFAWCQFASVAAMFWAADALARVVPFWPGQAVSGTDIWAVFRVDAVRALYAVLPAPLFWGASFSFALAAVAEDDEDTGEVVGRLSAANTLGAIGGALLTSLVLIPWLGTQHTQRLMLASGLLAGLLLFGRHVSSVRGWAPIGLATAATLLALPVVPGVPGILVAYGRHAAAWASRASEIVYVAEGMHASIAISRTADGVLNYHNAGKVQASSEPADMRLQRMLGHLTTLVPARPTSVLVIGFGAGVTAGAVSVNPSVERVTIVDIEPLVPRVSGRFMGVVNHDVAHNPKVRVIADDARHYLQTTTETFDAITSDPLDPWVKGAATLYTREFFETARAHLNPGGVMTLYVQLFESSPEAVKSEVATFFEAFPEGLVFGNLFDGRAIDMVLLGQAERPTIWVDEIEDMLRSPGFAAVDSSLVHAGIFGAAELFGSYAGRAPDLAGWLADAQVNRDRDLRLQYLAGLGLNQHSGDDIYRDLVSYRAYPDDLFVASESMRGKLQAVMDGIRE
ncbi:MAG: fused MFS/spermidine synthase [Vicinamibacterales bacterium]